MSGEKKFKPGRRKLDKAAREGQLAKSSIASRAICLIAIITATYIIISLYWVRNQMLLEYCLTYGYKRPVLVFQKAGQLIISVTILVLGAGAVMAAILECLQVGCRFDWALSAFKAERLDPLAGFTKIFKNFRSFWIRLIYFALLISSTYFFVSTQLAMIKNLMLITTSSAPAVLLSVLNSALSLVLPLLIFCAALDYWLKRREFMKNMMMTEEEIRQEAKETECDPMQKNLRKALHEEILQQDLVKRVRASKVIIIERQD